MGRRAPQILLALVVAALSACARPAPPIPWSPAAAPLGIVLMHGKRGSPGYLANTKTALEDHGYLVSTPEMCWSSNRMYDRAYLDCVTEIDAAVADLRQRGAKSIVVAGHSMGGTAAVAYGANHDGLTGIIGFAAADAFFGPPHALPDIARAKSLVDEGKGDVLGEFEDIRPSGRMRMRTTAAHFLSFVSPPAAHRMPANAARLRAPLLMVAGTLDMFTLEYAARAYDRAPDYALNRFVQVGADHSGTLQAGMAPVLDWLASLMGGS
ncbi:MAG: alpha/beta hydrolase [Proteobacteria bacterium]|nr:alpha/beta hydrolase [Pseudomonadota bacterium]